MVLSWHPTLPAPGHRGSPCFSRKDGTVPGAIRPGLPPRPHLLQPVILVLPTGGRLALVGRPLYLRTPAATLAPLLPETCGALTFPLAGWGGQVLQQGSMES